MESINGSFLQIIGRVIANNMTESSNYATIFLDEAVVLEQDEDGILGTDSESEISEDDNDPSFVNHDSDWVNNLAVANFIPIFLIYSIRFACFCWNQALNPKMNLQKSTKTMLQLHFSRKNWENRNLLE